MGHNAVFGYVIWAIGQDLVMRYGSSGYGSAPWAIAPNQLAECRSTQQFLKACHILERDCDDKNVSVYKPQWPIVQEGF
jgi:hypothetical protein